MKRALHLFALLMLALPLLCGCGRKPYPPSLWKADSLASACPDSAVALLESLEQEMQLQPEATRMYYRLLRIKAHDKAYLPHTSDSLILPVLHYYIEKNDERHLPEAYYYAGRVYRDLGDAPQALDYFEKAAEALPKGTINRLLSLIYSQTGTLLAYQGLYAEALRMYEKSRQCDLVLKDSIGMVYTLRDIGNMYSGLGRPDSALAYMKEANQLCQKLQLTDLFYMIQSQLASLYIYVQEYDSAYTALQNTLRNVEHPNKSGIYSIASELYHQMGMMDSAAYYYTALLDFGTIHAKKAAYSGLAEIAMKEENSKLALQYIRAYRQCADSVEKLTQTETIHRMHSLYNYQLREKENEQLKQKNREKNYILLFATIGLGFLAASFFAYHQYAKRKSQELKFQLRTVEQIKEESYRKSQLFIAETKTRIRHLEEELSNMNAANEALREETLKQKELLCQDARRAEIEQNKQKQARKTVLDSEIYRLLRERLLDPQGRIFVKEEEWALVEKAINESYPDFLKKLSSICDLRSLQRQVCMLVKLGFSPSEIAKLTERPKETITSLRRRLYYRIFQEKGKPEDLDKFILSL